MSGSQEEIIETELEHKNEEEPKKKISRFGVRHSMIILLHTFLMCTFLTRSALSLTIVAMTDSTASLNPAIPTYDWTNQGIILSAFFWSYVVLQPLSGYIFIRFGFKWIVLGTMLINVLAFMLIPVSVYNYGSSGLIACRVVQGLVQGFCYPAIHHSLGLWVPKNERSFLAMITRAGNESGYIIGMVATGYICASRWGWPAVFYILGSICLVWCVYWALLAADCPAEHGFISESEQEYIESSLETREKEDVRSIPFKAIFTSLPFWAIAVANTGISWCNTLTDTALPLYLGNGLGLDITLNGITTAMTNAIQVFICIPLALFGDHWVSKNHFSMLTWRRMAQAIGSYAPSLAIIWLAFISNQQVTLGIALLYVYSGVGAILIFGSLVNHVDLSPRYAGVLTSIENTIAQIIAIGAPLIIEYGIEDFTNIAMWRGIFLSLAAVMSATGTFFIIFGKADIQWWNSRESLGSENLKKSDV